MMEFNENTGRQIYPVLGYSLAKGKGKGEDESVGADDDQENLDDDFDD